MRTSRKYLDMNYIKIFPECTLKNKKEQETNELEPIEYKGSYEKQLERSKEYYNNHKKNIGKEFQKKSQRERKSFIILTLIKIIKIKLNLKQLKNMRLNIHMEFMFNNAHMFPLMYWICALLHRYSAPSFSVYYYKNPYGVMGHLDNFPFSLIMLMNTYDVHIFFLVMTLILFYKKYFILFLSLMKQYLKW